MNKKLSIIKRYLFPKWYYEWPIILKKANNCCSLQLGSGLDTKIPGSINIDINQKVYPDVLFDLNNEKWPFENNQFDMVIAISILEHLDDLFKAMSEIHRISKPGALIYILVPHFSSSGCFIDPTHSQQLSARSLDYCTLNTKLEKNYSFYLPFRFKRNRMIISLSGILDFIPFMHFFVNKFVGFWEDYLCFLLRGEGIYWELEVLKKDKII